MKKILFISLLLIFAFTLFSENIFFKAEDNPNDDGKAIRIKWRIAKYEHDLYYLQRKGESESFTTISKIKEPVGKYIDSDDIIAGQQYTYRLFYEDGDEALYQYPQTTTMAKAQWFNTDKISLLILSVILISAILYFIYSARQGKELYLRKIAGLESMDESVGRATEMGKPILFIPGTLDLDNMQTISGLTILGKLAQKAAEHGSELIVPVCRSMVLSTAKEIVKESYLKAGRPDAYNPDSVFYLTDDQFGFVAGVDGIIVREKPAANFYLGAFFAESLILAETGFASGAIQTAGTAMPSQLPFFVVACDYTLIGEELYAASAYLSKEPQQLGSLKGQDVGKAVFVFVLVLGIILEISGIHFLKDFLNIH